MCGRTACTVRWGGSWKRNRQVTSPAPYPTNLRSLALDRFHFVGAASLVSLTGDASKVLVYADGGLLGDQTLLLGLAALPLMTLCTTLGRRVNQKAGERGYTVLFWTVMGGYVVRLLTP